MTQLGQGAISQRQLLADGGRTFQNLKMQVCFLVSFQPMESSQAGCSLPWELAVGWVGTARGNLVS